MAQPIGLGHVRRGKTLTLRRPNLLVVHGPLSQDLAKTVKVRSDHSENLTNVFGGADFLLFDIH